LNRQQWTAVALYGISLGAMNALFYQAIERIPLGLAVGIEFTGPLSVSLLSSRKPVDFIWALLAIVGIGLILPHSQTVQQTDLVGVSYALGAGACWAFYIMSGQRAGKSMHGGIATTLGMIGAAICAAPFGVIQAGARLFDFSLIPLALTVAVLSSALPYSLEMLALKRLPAQSFGILMSVEPAIAALSGFLLLNEKLSSIQWVAIACIMTASFGSVLRRERPEVLTDTP
jgi:inner membrane transporter RhtA